MTQSVAHVALVVRDYDEAIAFFTNVLGFTLVEDSYQPEQEKGWVVVAPQGSRGRARTRNSPERPVVEQRRFASDGPPVRS
jgi:catechol 2,3-dioxygenase-like lactoylglutathione lyase family enzyme